MHGTVWPTVWELAPITSSWARAPNLLTQELQRQDYTEICKVLTKFLLQKVWVG